MSLILFKKFCEHGPDQSLKTMETDDDANHVYNIIQANNIH